jgi:hypothetical protein
MKNKKDIKTIPSRSFMMELKIQKQQFETCFLYFYCGLCRQKLYSQPSSFHFPFHKCSFSLFLFILHERNFYVVHVDVPYCASIFFYFFQIIVKVSVSVHRPSVSSQLVSEKSEKGGRKEGEGEFLFFGFHSIIYIQKVHNDEWKSYVSFSSLSDNCHTFINHRLK